jgi:hypothetical protein
MNMRQNNAGYTQVLWVKLRQALTVKIAMNANESHVKQLSLRAGQVKIDKIYILLEKKSDLCPK